MHRGGAPGEHNIITIIRPALQRAAKDIRDGKLLELGDGGEVPGSLHAARANVCECFSPLFVRYVWTLTPGPGQPIRL